MKKFIFPTSYVLLLASLCLASADCAADAVLAEAYSATTALNNLSDKIADANETLLLPAAWGDTNAPTLTIVGEAVTTNGLYYTWNTDPLMPDEGYLVRIDYGNTNFTARFTVEALAMAEWGALDIDNLAERVAKNTEKLTLPAAWGDDATGLKLVWTDALGDHEKELDATAKSYAWSTLPLMPGAYGVKLSYGGTTTEVANYSVTALGEALADSGTFIDNKFDKDAAGSDVRDIANHTNEFNLSWQGVASAKLTLDGDKVEETTQENMSWFWETNGLTYALYSFTNTVDGSNYVARFRVKADNVAVMFHKDTNDVLVAKGWYQDNVQTLGVADSRKVISEALKQIGPNGYALWKSYVLNIGTNETIDLTSNISVTNLELGVVQVTVWPTNFEQHVIREGTQAEVNYGIDYTESLSTQKWIRAKNLISSGDIKYTETLTNKVQRFYRTKLDVEPTPKTQQ